MVLRCNGIILTMTFQRMLIAAALCGAATILLVGRTGSVTDTNATDIYLDRGAAGLSRSLAELKTRASVLMIVAHPDDEDGGMLAMQTRGLGARGGLMTLTRGEGGQNAMSNDMYDALGLVRTQELLQAGRYYGVQQFWGRAIDYGFSKTREEAIEKWGYDRTLSDAVRVIRMFRPLVVTSVFIGAPTDGHGNHQVAGQMAQEAYVAAGDPKRFPEQIREGLRPWSPLKVYERVPFFTPTKEKTIYDYATDQFVPLRFYDYVNKKWSDSKPTVDVTIPEGTRNAAAGLTYQQIGREGWGFQKSQNGGGILPPPALVSVDYHRYGSRVPAAGKENSFYDGIDISLHGIASLTPHAPAFLTEGISKFEAAVDEAAAANRPAHPELTVRPLAQALKLAHALRRQVEESSVPEPEKSDVAFELGAKERQCERALVLALGLNFEANVAPAKPPSGPFAAFAGVQPTLTNVVPGQTFFVQTALLNGSDRNLRVESITLHSTDDQNWNAKAEKSPEPTLAAGKEVRQRFELKVPEQAALTRAYFTRPNQEQPYYDLRDDRYRNLSLAPYPLEASARVMVDDSAIELREVVQTASRVEGIGIVQAPLYVAPALSVSVSPGAGAVPLDAKNFDFACTLRSNVKHAAGKVHLQLPEGWRAEPAEAAFNIAREGETETISFNVTPSRLESKRYELRVEAALGDRKFSEGYQLVGYPGLRPYPDYHPATFQVSAVNVKVAKGLHIGFYPGTGDDIPQALADLKVPVRTLNSGDIEAGDFGGLDAIILGVRAYQARPELRAANNRLLNYVKNGGVLIVQYNVANFDESFTPYPLSLGSNPEKVVDEFSKINFLEANAPSMLWPNRLTPADFADWEEERGHGFVQKWDKQFVAPIETHDPGQKPQAGGLLIARYGKGVYVYNAFALHRQLPAGVPGAYRILANLISLGQNPQNAVPPIHAGESQ